MVEWVKNWAPIIATVGALIGVMVTVRGASRTYHHGLIEKRKDHQRELVGELLANTQQWCGLLDVIYPAMAKMSTNDMMEFADTDSGRRVGELAKAVQIVLIKCLCEISDARIRPSLGSLEQQRRALTEGDDVAPMFDPNQGDTQRFQALLLMLSRVRDMKRTCDEIQLAAIQALPVEIEHSPRGQRVKKWLNESMFVA